MSTRTFLRIAAAALAVAAAAHPARAVNRRVVGWGDSITYGYYDYTSQPPANGTCWNGPATDPPETCGYVKRLDDRLNDPTLSLPGPIWDIGVLNLGKGGEATTEALSRMDRTSWTCPCEALGTPCPINSLKYWVCNGTLHEHDVMVLMEGTNDITRDIGASTIAFDLQQLGQKAAALGLDPVITTVTPRHKYTWFEFSCPPLSQRNIIDANTKVQSLNAQILDLAGQTGWPLADVFTHFWKKKDHGLLTADYQNWQWMRCDPSNPDPNTGDPVGHPDADGFDLMSWKSEGWGQTYDETIEYQVKVALPPRLALTAPAPPITTGVAATFTVDLYDLGTTGHLIWDFGDGTYLYSQVPATTPVTRDHVYTVPGTYDVTATAENFYGSPRSQTVTVDVTGADLTIFRDGFESADTSNWSVTQP